MAITDGHPRPRRAGKLRPPRLSVRTFAALGAVSATVVACPIASGASPQASSASAITRTNDLPGALTGPTSEPNQIVASVRPKYIVFTVTLGGPVFRGAPHTSGIRWTRWTAQSAVGQTVIWIDTGVPNLAQGYRPAESALLTLSAPKMISGRLLFTRMRLSHVKVLRRLNSTIAANYRLTPNGARAFGWLGYGWAPVRAQ
jgi:hypothetical protein